MPRGAAFEAPCTYERCDCVWGFYFGGLWVNCTVGCCAFILKLFLFWGNILYRNKAWFTHGQMLTSDWRTGLEEAGFKQEVAPPGVSCDVTDSIKTSEHVSVLRQLMV